MKTFILLLIIGVSTFPIQLCSAQTELKTPIIQDTLYANDTKNVALFFPNPIRQGITGSENLLLTEKKNNTLDYYKQNQVKTVIF